MEEVLGLVGFGLGASLGIGVVRAAGGGLRPLLRQVVRAGIALGRTARSSASRVKEGVAGATAEARESLSDLRAEALAERAGQRPRGSIETRKIAIARE